MIWLQAASVMTTRGLDFAFCPLVTNRSLRPRLKLAVSAGVISNFLQGCFPVRLCVCAVWAWVSPCLSLYLNLYLYLHVWLSLRLSLRLFLRILAPVSGFISVSVSVSVRSFCAYVIHSVSRLHHLVKVVCRPEHCPYQNEHKMTSCIWPYMWPHTLDLVHANTTSTMLHMCCSKYWISYSFICKLCCFWLQTGHNIWASHCNNSTSSAHGIPDCWGWNTTGFH